MSTIRNRAYLTRQSILLPSQSAWRKLFAAKQDASYLAVMGLTVWAFKHLENRFTREWLKRHKGRRFPHPEDITPADALGLALHFMWSRCEMTTLQLIFGLPPATCSRNLNRALDVLEHILPKMKHAAILWPSNPDQFAKWADLIRRRQPRIKNAFGFVDGLNLRVKNHGDPDIQNAFYNQWLSGTYTTNLIVFSPIGTIIWMAINFPGSWHDMKMVDPLMELLVKHTPFPYCLVGDCGFSVENTIRYIETPLKAGDLTNYDNQGMSLKAMLAKCRRHRAIVSIRQAAEWGMHSVQAFSRLQVPLMATQSKKRRQLIFIACHLHNIRSNLCELSQIRSVYDPEWKEGIMITEDYEHLSKFYQIPTY